jgi:hypothetical protein
MLRAETVDDNRLFRVAGAAVYIRPGGWMNDDFGPVRVHKLVSGIVIGNIHLFNMIRFNYVHAHQIMAAPLEFLHQPPTQAACCSCHNDTHRFYPPVSTLMIERLRFYCNSSVTVVSSM